MDKDNMYISKHDKIKKIIDIEWKMFDRVNKGKCRASCQENPETFNLMRRSQFEAWSEKLLDSYLTDLLRAESCGQNLIELKYIYMMHMQEPEKYIHDPIRPSADASFLVNQIMLQMNVWTEELMQAFPKLRYCSRPVRSDEDSLDDTSIETYQTCELYTYSVNTLQIYRDYIQQLLADNKNLPYMIVRNTALLQSKNYGKQ